jgi:hypothetical protein
MLGTNTQQNIEHKVQSITFALGTCTVFETEPCTAEKEVAGCLPYVPCDCSATALVPACVRTILRTKKFEKLPVRIERYKKRFEAVSGTHVRQEIAYRCPSENKERKKYIEKR